MVSLLAVLMLAPNAEAADAPMQVGARFRMMSVPDLFLDPYLFDEEGAPRPKATAYAAGLELTIVNVTQWTFYLERIGITMEEGYFDDIEEPADHFDGEWIVPSNAFGLIALGANAGKEIPITDVDKDVWVDFNISGGLGIGVVTGNLTRWRAGENVVSDPVLDVGCMPDSQAVDRKDGCEDDGQVKIPPVAPLLDFNLGFQFHFGDYVYLRLEGGVHDFLYAGGALGGRF